MATRFIETEFELRQAIKFIQGQKLPLTVNVTVSGKRSSKQNRLNRKWMLDIADQVDGWSTEYARGYCKLHFDISILRNEEKAFCREYDALVRPLPYEHKIKLMMVPFDFGVTRLMTVKQQTRYLDAVERHFSKQGVVLTDPEGLLQEELGRNAA
ncbi:hypothetical protein [Ochrobactrum sp. Marseille-Q0166]|uniref:hypothetical protein n=1 Tax=Ochrobactrum sp. Marseille-Q0166 TaxID=2761105 RepID=UPI0016551C93|nr:hypothetical protein [Ochrobactrum sp. Marseille-Q0166]MBC8719039.1 hypothetical protein [Ochrobactrum sp. Marseille-Q0166]